MPKDRQVREKAAVAGRHQVQMARLLLDNDRVGTPTDRAFRAESAALKAETEIKAFRQAVEREATALRRTRTTP